jgi:23S rRNA (pseudouridine1915-N3)-methyltransferase
LKLRVLSFGKDRSGLFAPAVAEYAGRLEHYTSLELLELPAGRTPEEEAQVLEARLLPDERLIALDERGEVFTSTAFARLLGEERERGGRLAFVVGGDEGLDRQVLARARRTLQLSAFTLPHRLARLVLMEQLYRSFTLLKGEPYHK